MVWLRGWLCLLCSSSLSCGGLSWTSHSDYLQTVLSDREPLFRTHRLSIFFIWLKILQCWNGDGGGGGVSREARAVSKGTEVTPVKWYQGKELFLWPVVLSLTKKSRWLGCTCRLNTLLLCYAKLRCLWFTWRGLCHANWSHSHNISQVLEDALKALVHYVFWRESDGAVP